MKMFLLLHHCLFYQWVQEGSPSHSTLVKIESPHQFVPKTGDPNEFKKKQKEVCLLILYIVHGKVKFSKQNPENNTQLSKNGNI